MPARSLLKRLKRQGATEAEAQALLACRDAVLAEQRQLGGRGEGEGKGEGEGEAEGKGEGEGGGEGEGEG